MGLFSRKTIITVSSQHVSLLEDENPNIDKEAVFSAIITHSSISQALMKAKMHGMYAMAERYYYYGKTKFTNGLPEGTADHEMVSDMRLLQVLYKEFPDYRNVRIGESSRDTADPYMFAFDILRDTYGYDYSTGIAKSGPDGESYLMEAESADIGLIRLDFKSIETEEETSVIVSVPGFEPSEIFFHVTYTHSANKEESIWIYKVGSNEYPEIEKTQTVKDLSPYYPVVPIRSWNKDMAAKNLVDTPLYRTSTVLLKKLTMGFGDLANSINTNPNVGKIDNVFFGVKVDIRDDSPIVSEYLGRYFYSQYKVNKDSKEKHDAWKEGSTGRPPPYTTVMFRDGFYKHSISFSHIETSIVAGKIDIPTVEFNIRSRGKVWTKWWRSFEYDRSSVTYVYQDGLDIRTITIHGLVAIDFISGKHNVSIDLGNSDNSTTQLMIPVHRGVIQEMNLGDRNALFHHAMYLTINTYDKRKQKWYETSAFKTIITIVGIVAIYLSWGALTGQVIAVLGATYAVAAIIAAVILVASGAIMKYAAKLLIDTLGIEWAKWFIAVLIVASVMIGINGSTNAALVSHVAIGVSEGFQEEIEDMIEDLVEDLEEAQQESDDFQEKLEGIMDEIMGDRLDVDTSALLKEARRVEPIHLKQESAEQYYARIDGSRHMNEYVLGVPSVFHETTLLPPTIDQLLETFKKD
jgi:hypothetical protein